MTCCTCLSSSSSPAHLSLPYIEHSKMTKWAGRLSKQQTRWLYSLFCFQQCVIWIFGEMSRKGKKKCSYIWSQMCVEENVPHNRGLYGTLVLARSQRCPPRAAVLLKTVFFFSFSPRVEVYLPFGLLTKAAVSSAHILSRSAGEF